MAWFQRIWGEITQKVAFLRRSILILHRTARVRKNLTRMKTFLSSSKRDLSYIGKMTNGSYSSVEIILTERIPIGTEVSLIATLPTERLICIHPQFDDKFSEVWHQVWCNEASTVLIHSNADNYYYLMSAFHLSELSENTLVIKGGMKAMARGWQLAPLSVDISIAAS